MCPTATPRYVVCCLSLVLLLAATPSRAQTLYVTNTTNISTSQSYNNGFIGSSNTATSLTGRLTIDSGAVINITNAFTLGNVTNAPNNSVIISGDGSSLDIRAVTVGNSGSGNSIVVTNGGRLSTDGNAASGSATTSVGSSVFSSNNAVILSGEGSSWRQTNTTRVITIGDNGSGNRLVVSNGADMSVTVAVNVGGTTNSSNNSVIVTGAGTTMTNRGFNLQRGANHSLEISDGAQVVATESTSQVGALALGNNPLGSSAGHSALVTGAGTTFTAAGRIYIGNGGGNASMVVSGGANVVQTNGAQLGTTVGIGATSSGSSLQVTGAGTVWTNAAFFTVGNAANTNSSMTINDGALVAVARGVTVGDSSNSTGALMTVDNATLNIFDETAGTLLAGRNGSQNRLVVTNGGDINVINTFGVGQGASDVNGAHSNTALVTGAGSTIFQAALTGSIDNRIGGSGRGNSLVVSNGASVVMGGSSTGFAKNVVGWNTNSSENSLRVTGSGSTWGGRSDLEIGFFGSSNFVSVTDGGLISNGVVRIGVSNSATGNYLLVDGAGSVFSNRVSMTVGNGANTGNRLTVTNGGVLHAGGSLDVRSNSTASAAGSVWVGQNRPSAQAINILNANVSSNSILTVNGNFSASGTVTVATRGALGGAGTVQSDVIITNGGTLTPGNSPGTLTVDGDLTWLGGGNYNWQIHNATGLVGTGWDSMLVTGTLDLSALTVGSKFNINLWSLSAISPDANGAAINFDNTLDGQSWEIITAVGGITGFDAAEFNIRTNSTNGTAGFANALAPGGFFAVEQVGNSINLTYTVPEPSTYALIALAGAGAALMRWRRRKQH